jgi:outer membrane protein OmpA-like peptidoglycan-associated protein
MMISKSPSSRRGWEKKAWRRARRFAILAVVLGLGACNPVETWRDWTGASQNDPDPETTPNTQNLAAGEASDYPNLATVPPPPTRALTAAEREKLTQSLIADQANARHTNEQLRAGFPAVSAPPPPPPPPIPPVSELGNAQSAPAAAAVPPSPPSPASSSATAGGAPSAVPSPNVAAATGSAAGKMPAAPGQGLRKQGELPEPGPMESSLEMPQARATPVPEQFQVAPPVPQLPPAPRIANTANTPRGALPGAPVARGPLPEATGSAAFQPPPPAPELPPLPPNRSAAAAPGKGGQKPPAPTISVPVAEIRFGGGSTSLTDADRQALATVVPLYQQNPGKVRIVGYAGAGGGAVEQLNSYRAALDRAQAVAAALTQAGIPSDKIQAEAAPTGTSSGESRAEILLEH